MLTKRDLQTLVAPGGRQPPGMIPIDGIYTCLNMFGDNDGVQNPDYVIPYQQGKSAHAEFPEACNDGQIVATAAPATSCSLVIGRSPKNPGMMRGYHDFGYVVTLRAARSGTPNFESNGGDTGFVNFPP